MSSYEDLGFEVTDEMLAELTDGKEERDDREQPRDGELPVA